jgi:F-type H+-transporting ATPase subunit alpha
MDATTMSILDKGRKNVELLKQAQYSPVPVAKQVAIIYCGTNGLMKNVPVSRIAEFETAFLNEMELAHKDILDAIGAGKIDDNITKVLTEVAAHVSVQFS